MGTALGTLVVTTLLDVSWPVRVALVVVVVVVGLAYVLWRHRAEIQPAASGGASPTDAGTEPSTQAATPQDPTPPPATT